jgi:hypothetical protein
MPLSMPRTWSTSSGPRRLMRCRIAASRSIRSGRRDIERLAIRVHQLTDGLLSEPTQLETPAGSPSKRVSRRQSIMRMAAHSTSELVIAPCFFRTSASTQAGHAMRQTSGVHHRVHGSHTPPAPSALASQ